MLLLIKKNLSNKHKFQGAVLLRLVWLSTVLLLAACKHYGAQGELIKTKPSEVILPYFDSLEYEYHYTAKIRAYNNDLNGILIVKKMDAQHKRVVMLSDFGNTIFNFEFKNGKARAIYVMADLNKKIIVNRLLLYFDFFTRSSYESSKHYIDGATTTFIGRLKKNRVKIEQTGQNLHTMRLVSRWKEKAEVRYYANSNYADSISFQSKELPISMFFVKREKVLIEGQ